eukprot:101579_1
MKRDPIFRRKPISLIRLLFIVLVFTLTCAGIYMSRKSKRKQEEVLGQEFDNEHVVKKYKKMCSGLLQYNPEILDHVKKYYHIFHLDYNQLSLELLHKIRNDTYFFCNGDGYKQPGSSQCNACINGSNTINPCYNLFDQSFVREVCLFMDAIMIKTNWKETQIFSNSNDGNTIEFTIAIDKHYTNNRGIQWIISSDKMIQVNDIKREWVSKSDTEINHKYLFNYFKKWLPIKVVICGGVVGRDWYHADVFNCNTTTVRWINDGEIIAHSNCPYINGKKKICKWCKGLRTRIDRKQDENNYDKTPSKHTSTPNLNSIQKDLKIKALEFENAEMKNEILMQQNAEKAIKKQFSLDLIVEDAKLNNECGLMFEFILKNYEEVKLGLTERGADMSKINFLHDQFEYGYRTYVDWKNDSGHNKRKGHRWSSVTLDFASDLLSRGSGAYRKAARSPAMKLPHQATLKRGIMKWRHTEQRSHEIMESIERAMILKYDSMEEARKQIYHAALDEIICSNDANMNVSNFNIDGRPAFHDSDGLLTGARHTLYTAKNNIIDDVSGSKYMMQFILCSSTSNFVYYGPFFGSDSGLNCIEILSYLEKDFLLPMKLNLNIEIKSIHGDLNKHHQSYILYKTGKKK